MHIKWYRQCTGKTTLLVKIVNHFDQYFRVDLNKSELRVLWICCFVDEEDDTGFKQLNSDIVNKVSLDDVDETGHSLLQYAEKWIDATKETHGEECITVIVLDDLQLALERDASTRRFLSVIVHHKKTSLFISMQSIHSQSHLQRRAIEQCMQYVILPSPALNRSIKTLSSTVFGDNKHINSALDMQPPYGPVVVRLSGAIPAPLRLTTLETDPKLVTVYTSNNGF